MKGHFPRGFTPGCNNLSLRDFRQVIFLNALGSETNESVDL